MTWAGHVALWGTGEMRIWFWWGSLRERDHLRDLSVDRGIILNWILKETGGMVWTGFIWFSIETSCGLL
jgi:hypothetical protein